MPILDPSLQICLIKKFNEKKVKKGSLDFFLHYLRVASRYMNSNVETVETSILFKNDLKKSIIFINDELGCNFRIDQDFNCTIKDFYKHLYKRIVVKSDIDKKSKTHKGTYFICNDQFNTKFYRPLDIYHEQHAWFLSDTPVAVLCINDRPLSNKFIRYVKLEIDLMVAAGFTLVLCAAVTPDTFNFYLQLIKDDQFAEIHLNIYDESYVPTFYKELSEKVHSHIDDFKGYIYIYSHFPERGSDSIIQELKKKTHIKIITFCKKIEKTFIEVNLFPVKPFLYCKTGFKSEYLRIRLSNVPLYEHSDSYLDFISTQVSGVSLAYISPSDFLKWNIRRTKILYCDPEDNNHHCKKYINYDDIHEIKADLYVNKTLALKKISKYKLKEVKRIQKKLEKKDDKKEDKNIKFSLEMEKLKEHIISLFKEQKIREGLEYVGYAYTKCSRERDRNFKLHDEQILTALEACRTFFKRKAEKEKGKSKENETGKEDKEKSKNKEKEKITNKGMIYQVETGEGKSCIVCLIAAVLALNGKTVHITSSNIKLANRDYYKSYKFFKMLGFESAILLHDNELPFSLKDRKTDVNSSLSNINLNEFVNDSNFSVDNSNNQDDDEFFGRNSSTYLLNIIRDENAAFRGEYYPDKFFSPNLFKNPSRMNFSVCGIDNNNKYSAKNRASIIFSTFVNFECLYLRMMETCRGFVDSYFKSCGLLIDEADSILLDEITNGTIVSREMKSNAKPILKFVFQQFRSGISAEETYHDIVNYWPNHGSLEQKDVEQMYEEIDLVLNDQEFSHGKKYYIATIQVKNSGRIKRLMKKTTNFVKKVTDKCLKKIEKIKQKAIQLPDKLFDKNKRNSIGKSKIIDSEKTKNTDSEKSKIVDSEKSKIVDSKKTKNTDSEKSKIVDLLKQDANIENEFELVTETDEEEEKEEEEEEEDNNDFENEEEEIADSPIIEYKHIVPFDYDHKGVLEPNKEFSGFIQQFIAIKEGEKKGNENMIIKDLAMNYLYVSHPIFVNLYGKVCGFTGTIGSKTEQLYYHNLYHLKTKKIPRNKPNLRVELPTILCDSIDERDKTIVAEVKAFHEKDFPVLVIFQDLTEIVKVQHLLNSNQINFINIFDGKDEVVRPDNIAGCKGAVSLGTNVCGRGTDIIIQSKPLHVILTYFSSNTRVMRQAFGRTARQGQKGTYRVICLKEQFHDPHRTIDETTMDKAIQVFEIKNEQQEKFIDRFKKRRPWIFSGDIKKQRLTSEQIADLRSSEINVNRIVAYNYQFPICMTTEIFLKIQAQKIFSIFNCPNSKYTWILFQRYLREMILESWTLMLNKFDLENSDKLGTNEYRSKLHNARHKLCKEIEIYLKKSKKKTDYNIIPTFMHIHKIVLNNYKDKIKNIYQKMSNAFKQTDPSKFISFQIGFRPYSLLTNSGARVNAGNVGEMNYIIDPELRYERKMPEGRISIISITERIDDIFNKICQSINKFIGQKAGLKFFLRRTLGGCEFGVCFDAIMRLSDKNNDILNDYYCLVDKDPLFSFTIFVKNTAPILAGILIIVLVFLAVMSEQIIAWIAAFLPKLGKLLVKKGIKLIINYAAETFLTKVFEKIANYLIVIVKKQIDDIKKDDDDVGIVLENLFSVFENMTLQTIGKSVGKKMGCKVKVKSQFGKLIKNSINTGILIKIGILLVFSVATFMMHFNSNKQRLKNESKDASEFDKNYSPKTAEKLKKKNMHKASLDKLEVTNDDLLNHGFEKFKEGAMDSFLFKMELADTTKFMIKRNDFLVDPKPSSKKNRIGNAIITYLIVKKSNPKNPKKCFLINYYGNTKAYKQEVVLYSTFKSKLIVPFIGYYVERMNDFICLDYPQNGFLDEYLMRKDKDHCTLTKSNKLIIAYGIAYVMNYLHDCHVVHRDLKPANICLDDHLYPYLYNFYSAKQIDKKEKSKKILLETSLRFMAPEFIENPASCQNSFKLDIYSYGMLLYSLITETQPFQNYIKRDVLIYAIVNGERPEFPIKISPEWVDLISKCWDQEPSNRPTFTDILNELNSHKFVDNINEEEMFNNYKNSIIQKKKKISQNDL